MSISSRNMKGGVFGFSKDGHSMQKKKDEVKKAKKDEGLMNKWNKMDNNSREKLAVKQTNDPIWKMDKLGPVGKYPFSDDTARANYLPTYQTRAGKVKSFKGYQPVIIPFIKKVRNKKYGFGTEAYAHKDMDGADEVPHKYPNPDFVGDDCQYLTKYLKGNARAQCINQVRDLNFIKTRKEYKTWNNKQEPLTTEEMTERGKDKVRNIKGNMRGIARKLFGGGKKRKTRKRRKSRKKHTKKYGKRRGNKSQRRRRKRKTRKH